MATNRSSSSEAATRATLLAALERLPYKRNWRSLSTPQLATFVVAIASLDAKASATRIGQRQPAQAPRQPARSARDEQRAAIDRAFGMAPKSPSVQRQGAVLVLGATRPLPQQARGTTPEQRAELDRAFGLGDSPSGVVNRGNVQVFGTPKRSGGAVSRGRELLAALASDDD